MLGSRELLRSKSCFLPALKLAFHSSQNMLNKTTYQVVVVGGGTGGCSAAAQFSSKLGKGKVAVVEPADIHYYQPMWTLVGGGMKTLKQSGRPMSQVLPKNAEWYKQKATTFLPGINKIVLDDGTELGYEFLVVAMGLQLNYSDIKGLPQAFETPGVCSNFSHLYVEKTLKSLEEFNEGNMIFTHPHTPIKCPGASQKIVYIADEYLRKKGKIDKAQLMFNTAGPVLFGVKKYADALRKIVDERNIKVNLKQNLVEILPDKKEAIFKKMDTPNETVSIPYEMIHITPPMSPPDILRNSKDIVDRSGFLNVNKETLQHVDFPNIFGIGDCTNLPTSKTGAAVAAQLGVLQKNLTNAMKGKSLTSSYDGYTSCPLVTGYSKCILAEFDYNAEPLETFPLNQAKERRLMFFMKKDMMPQLYWRAMLNGHWKGPKMIRKLMHLGLSK